MQQRSVDEDRAKRIRQQLPSSAAQRALPSMLLRRSELLRRGGGGMNTHTHSLSVSSCASEASDDSFCSRATTGRIGRRLEPRTADHHPPAAGGGCPGRRRRRSGQRLPRRRRRRR